MTASEADAQSPISRPEPLRKAVYTRVVELISSGKFEPGEPLTEAGLSRALQVSRTPVREALLQLQAEGILQSVLARGFTLRPLDPRDAAELYPILANLEALAIQMIATLNKGTLKLLQDTMDELENCTEPVRRWQLDSRWHTALTSAAGNHHLERMISQLRTNLSRFELAYMRKVHSRTEANAQHQAIIYALTAGELDRSAELNRQHWHEGMNLVLNWLEYQNGE